MTGRKTKWILLVLLKESHRANNLVFYDKSCLIRLTKGEWWRLVLTTSDVNITLSWNYYISETHHFWIIYDVFQSCKIFLNFNFNLTLLHITHYEKYMRTTEAGGLNGLRSAKKTVKLTEECNFQVSSIDNLITDSLPFLNLSTSMLVPSRLSFLPSVVLPPVKLSERIEKSNS